MILKKEEIEKGEEKLIQNLNLKINFKIEYERCLIFKQNLHNFETIIL